MKNDLTTGAWQHDIGCPISITLLSTSDGANGEGGLMPVVLDVPTTTACMRGSMPGQLSSLLSLTPSDGFHNLRLAFGWKGEDKDNDGNNLRGRDDGEGTMTREG
jgi:hypothetical protein